MSNQAEHIHIPSDAPLRHAAHQETKCRTCKHIARLHCDGINLERVIRNGYCVVTACSGYETEAEK